MNARPKALWSRPKVRNGPEAARSGLLRSAGDQAAQARHARRFSIRSRTTLCLFLIAAASALTQETAGQRRAVVLAAANLSPAGEAQEYQRLISEALAMEIAAAGFSLVPTARWQAARADLGIAELDLVSGPHALALARAVEADVAATGLYRVEDRRIIVDIKFYDAKQERLIAAVARAGRTGLAVYNLVNEAVLEVASLLAKPLEPIPPLVAPPDPGVRMVSVTSADEGAEILVAGRPVTTVSQGRASIPTATVGTEVTVETRRTGFQTRRQRVHLPAEAGEVALRPLWPETRWAAEALYSSGQSVGLGLGARYYLVPDMLFLSGDNYFYVQSTFAGADSPVFHDDLRFLMGRYLFLGPYSPVRVGVAAGVGGIFTVFAERDAGQAFDPYLSPLNFWIEWNNRRWSLYWRVEGKYAAGSGGALLPRGWLTVADGGPPMTLGVLYKW